MSGRRGAQAPPSSQRSDSDPLPFSSQGGALNSCHLTHRHAGRNSGEDDEDDLDPRSERDDFDADIPDDEEEEEGEDLIGEGMEE